MANASIEPEASIRLRDEERDMEKGRLSGASRQTCYKRQGWIQKRDISTDIDTERQMESQIDRDTHRQTDRDTHRQTNIDRHRQRWRDTDKHR
jgi:hypothetical protein